MSSTKGTFWLTYRPRGINPITHPDSLQTFFLTEPLLVRLTTDTGKLSSGYIYSLPRRLAELLILHKLATAVGSLGILPDLTLTEDELAEMEQPQPSVSIAPSYSIQIGDGPVVISDTPITWKVGD